MREDCEIDEKGDPSSSTNKEDVEDTKDSICMSKYLSLFEKTPPRVLVVGAGGIGCELLKNLVLSNFLDIVVIDLDTIDVTNLNRQFLFQRQHVGLAKADVAKESALKFNPKAKIKSIKDSIMNPEYSVSFFKTFDVVLNALDNKAARSHVNRMCLASNVPLVESGTAGYLGQVTVIRKGETECYECQPKPHQKTFPGCTIRNTPSEPIHCIVWAKHLFNQLFGDADDEDISPDTSDPELKADGKSEEIDSQKTSEKDNKESDEISKNDSTTGEEPQESNGSAKGCSTREWAEKHDYNPKLIFSKLFSDDIKYLLTMDKLWQTRTKPLPLTHEQALKVKYSEIVDINNTTHSSTSQQSNIIKDQIIWSMKKCVHVFENSINSLNLQLKEKKEKKKSSDKEAGDDFLTWDKDDESAMDFVASCANIRSFIFHIKPLKSRFDVKSMAGNIIPAIATTNAIIGGCIVIEAIKILTKNFQKCVTTFIARKPNPRKMVLVTCELSEPNSNCYVCTEKPEVSLKLNTKQMSLKDFEEKVMKKELGMVAPDVEIDGRGVILISSERDEEGETEVKNGGGENGENESEIKVLSDFSICDGTILTCDDFLQNYNLKLIIYHCETFEDGKEFEVVNKNNIKNGLMNTATSSNPSTSGKSDLKQGITSSHVNTNDNDDIQDIDEGEEEIKEIPIDSTGTGDDDVKASNNGAENSNQVSQGKTFHDAPLTITPPVSCFIGAGHQRKRGRNLQKQETEDEKTVDKAHLNGEEDDDDEDIEIIDEKKFSNQSSVINNVEAKAKIGHEIENEKSPESKKIKLHSSSSSLVPTTNLESIGEKKQDYDDSMNNDVICID